MSRAWVAALALLAAGCLSDGDAASDLERASAPGPSQAKAPPASAPPAQPQDGLGSLRVTTVTGEVQPIEGVEVVLAETELGQVTDKAGIAVFNDLQPGAYTVLAAKAGYRAVQERGRVVQVEPDAVAEATLVLEPVPVVDASNSYHKTVPIRGFISCSFEGRTLGYTNNCGRGVIVGSTQVGDPNDKTISPYVIESNRVQAVLKEAIWTPSQPALGTDLHASTFIQQTCNPNCLWSNSLHWGEGKSPLIIPYLEGEKGNITRKLGATEKDYPRTVWVNVRASCPSSAGCTIQIMFQQRYDLFATVFYGGPPTAGFTALPPS